MRDRMSSFLELLGKHPGGLTLRRAARLLGIDRVEYRNFKRAVLRMLREDKLQRYRGRFLLPAAQAPPGSPRVEPRRRRPPLPVDRIPPAFAPASVAAERAEGMAELMREFALPAGFGRRLLAASEEVARRDPAAAPQRLDLAGLRVLCIDPADARDHDDAISLEPLPAGGQRLGVHIADVAAYVDEDGLIDLEARRRGNSTYFYLDTVPMLPPLLSGEVCSLREDRPRAALSVWLELDADARPRRVEIAETRVTVTHGLDYGEAQALLDGEDGAEPAATLRRMRDLARRLAAQRAEGGALQFELPEIRPVDLGDGVERFAPAPILASHGIVEEFMLAANHAVGRLLHRRGIPHLRRVHERPDPEDVAELEHAVSRRGVPWRPGRSAGGADYHELARLLAGRSDREVLLMKLLRSLQKAAYQPRDLGHFGLGWRDYVHYTSPIRRYADLHVHRLVKALLRGEARREGEPQHRLTEADGGGAAAPRRMPRASRELEALGRALSETELNSLRAERESLKLEMVLWARRRLGETLDATVVSITPTGLVLRLPASGVEGFLPAQFLGDEYWAHDEEREVLRGERSGRVFAEGQSLRARLVGASLATRRLQFFLEDPGKADDNPG